MMMSKRELLSVYEVKVEEAEANVSIMNEERAGT